MGIYIRARFTKAEHGLWQAGFQTPGPKMETSVQEADEGVLSREDKEEAGRGGLGPFQQNLPLISEEH